MGGLPPRADPPRYREAGGGPPAEQAPGSGVQIIDNVVAPVIPPSAEGEFPARVEVRGLRGGERVFERADIPGLGPTPDPPASPPGAGEQVWAVPPSEEVLASPRPAAWSGPGGRAVLHGDEPGRMPPPAYQQQQQQQQQQWREAPPRQQAVPHLQQQGQADHYYRGGAGGAASAAEAKYGQHAYGDEAQGGAHPYPAAAPSQLPAPQHDRPAPALEPWLREPGDEAQVAPSPRRVGYLSAMKELRGGPSEQQKAHAEERRLQLLRDLDEQVRAKKEQKAREKKERQEQEAAEERRYQAARQKFFQKSFFKDNVAAPASEGDPPPAGQGAQEQAPAGAPPVPPAAGSPGRGGAPEEVLSPQRGVPDAGVLEAQPLEAGAEGSGEGQAGGARPRTPDASGSPGGAATSKKPARVLRTPVNHAPPSFPAPLPGGAGGNAGPSGWRDNPGAGAPRAGDSRGLNQSRGDSRQPGKMRVLLKEVKEEQGKLRQELASQAAVIERLHHEAVVAHKERDAAMEQLKWARYSRYRAPPTPMGEFIVDSYMLPKKIGQIPESSHLESVELPHELASVQHHNYPTQVAAIPMHLMATPVREPVPLRIPAAAANVTPAVGAQVARFDESPPRAAPRARGPRPLAMGGASKRKPRAARERGGGEPSPGRVVQFTPFRGGYIAKEASELDLPPAVLLDDEPLDPSRPRRAAAAPGRKPKKPRPRDILAAGPRRPRRAAAEEEGPRPRWH